MNDFNQAPMKATTDHISILQHFGLDYKNSFEKLMSSNKTRHPLERPSSILLGKLKKQFYENKCLKDNLIGFKFIIIDAYKPKASSRQSELTGFDKDLEAENIVNVSNSNGGLYILIQSKEADLAEMVPASVVCTANVYETL
uniref:Uncharacterized protein n=1 Tax=Glossina brevipalpis TaxID=37001 RepID=A0A1A9WCX1_9MUSC